MTKLGTKTIIALTLLTIAFYIGQYILTPNISFDSLNQGILINYADGFVRRGLLGEILKILHNNFGLDVLLFIKYFSLLCYLYFCGYMIYLFRKNKISIFFLLLPYALPYYTLLQFIKIKDFFLLILFAISIHYLKNKVNKIFLFFSLNILTIIGILTHEMYLFFSVPIFIFLFLLKEFWNKENNILLQLFYSSIFFIPSIAVLLLSVYYHGDAETVNIMYKDVLAIVPEYTQDKDTKGWISSLGGNAEIEFYNMYKGLIWNGFSRGVTYSLFFIVILYLFLNFDKLNFNLFGKEKLRTINPMFLTSIFLIQFIAYLPIFTVAIDWQRWFSIIIYTSLLVSVQFIDYQDFTSPCHCYGVSRIGKVKNIIYYWVEVIPNRIKNLYSKFISSDENIVRFVALFCIVPYYPLGNTPYQFSNIFIMLHNFLSKVIYIVLN